VSKVPAWHAAEALSSKAYKTQKSLNGKLFAMDILLQCV
jgi:hypothetical protein